MEVLHLLSDNVLDRAKKMVWPICAAANNQTHYSYLISNTQHFQKGVNNKWLKANNLTDPKAINSFKRILNTPPKVIHIHSAELLPFVNMFKLNSKKVMSLYTHTENLVETFPNIDVFCFNSFRTEKLYLEQICDKSRFNPNKSKVVLDGVAIPSLNLEEFKNWLNRLPISLAEKPFFVMCPSSIKNIDSSWIKAFLMFDDHVRPNILLDCQDNDPPDLDFVHPLPSKFRLEAAYFSSGCIVETISPLSMMEYLHVGCPLITPFNDNEIVLNNFNGILCQSNKAQDWYLAYRKLAFDLGYRHKLKSQATQVAIQNYTLKRWKEDLDLIYE